MKTDKQKLGALGENIVADFYRDQGGQVIGRNVRYPFGEIDLIIEEPEKTIVFVEVKTRHGAEFGAAESVGRAKMRRLRRAAVEWLSHRPFTDIRFDVVAVTIDPHSSEVAIECFEGIEHGAR